MVLHASICFMVSFNWFGFLWNSICRHMHTFGYLLSLVFIQRVLYIGFYCIFSILPIQFTIILPYSSQYYANGKICMASSYVCLQFTCNSSFLCIFFTFVFYACLYACIIICVFIFIFTFFWIFMFIALPS